MHHFLNYPLNPMFNTMSVFVRNIEITPKEEKLLKQSFNKVDQTYCCRVALKQVQLYKKCSKQIENWLRQGIWYFEDILKKT